MAIQNLDNNNQLSLDQSWDGASGQQVEDLISRHLPATMEYDSTGGALTIKNEKGGIIVETTVSVAEPIYTHSIQIKGIYFDNTNSENQINKESIVCKLGTRIYLGVLYTYTATNPLNNKVSHITSKQKFYLNTGNGYVQLTEGLGSSEEIQYLDITDAITRVISSSIMLRATVTANISDKTVTASTPKVQVINPKLLYSGNTYIISNTISYTIQDGGEAKYLLYYSINGGAVKNQESLTLEIPNTGINKIEAYVQVNDNASIKSDSLTNQIIKPSDDITDVLYAINDVSSEVNNWEFARLYRLSIYYKNSSVDSATINTKLASTGDPDELYLNKTKEVSFTSSDGYLEMDISYFFGLDVTNTEFSAVLSVDANDESVMAWDSYTTINVVNSGSYSYTTNSSYSFDQYSPDDSNIITKDIISKAVSPDGLITDDSLSVFRLSAGNYPNNIIDLDLSNQLTNQGFTFELDFKTFNISDESKPILKLGRFILYPTEFNWQWGNVDESLVDTTARSSIFRNDVRTHLLVEVVPSFKIPTRELVAETTGVANKTISLVRVFINGCIDREYKYDYLSDFQYNGFKLQVSPETADVDIYGLRIYSRALSLEEIQNNYVSTMSSITEKQQFQKLNDLVATDSNNDTYISYAKTKDLYNTLIYVLPNKYKYPQQFNLKKGVSLSNCTVFINYVNNGINDTAHKLTDEQINRCSGRFTNASLSGQGTSAMKYYWYNIQMKKPKFTSKGCYDEETDEYIQPEENPNNYLFNSKYYYMPDDTSCELGIQKSCGKFNYASSMQSHKYGAVRAFHDLWDSCVDKTDFDADEIKGRKACLEDPFIVFYIESNLEDVSNYKLSDVQALNDETIKFAGFQTWGSAKGDKQTFGYDSEKTAGYILLEGAENDGELCNWLAPWAPNTTRLSGETWKTLYLNVSDQGEATYNESDSFDVDYGLDDNDDTGSTMSEAGNATLKRFIEAYNFAYMHTINLMPYTAKTSINDATGLDTTKKYYITSISYADNTYFKGNQWDVFRYDTYSKLWVPAGLPVLNEDGSQKVSTVKSKYNTDVFEYETFNLKTFYKSLGTSETGDGENIQTYLKYLKKDFKEHFGEYYHVDDLVYHQAFIRLFAGTDNRAKNTYFKLFDENSKIQMLQDDMDTILATDNRGLQKKPYYLLEPSLESDSTYKNMWGGKSAFFELIDVAYKTEIDNMLTSMLNKMNFQNTTASLDTWMDKYFYFIQKYYPAVAFNYTARLAYEDAQVIFDNQATLGVEWTNNGQTPLSQEHGSCLESEVSFMRKRLTMFLSQAKLAAFGREGSGIPIKTKEDAQSAQTYTVNITPYQYLYLGYLSGSVSNLYSENRVAAGEALKATIDITNTTPSYYVLGNSYIQGFDNFSQILYNSGEYTLNAPKLLEFSANTGTDDDPLFQPPSLILNCNVLEKLDLTNVRSLTSINLDSDHTPKLKEVVLTGTSISKVTLPDGDRLTKIHYPAALTDLTITNNNGLTDVQFESLNNLKTVNINCSKVGSFDISAFCEELASCPSLESVILKNLNHKISIDALRKLILLNATLTGKLTIVNSSNQLVDISYSDKANLVELYGNIDSESNALYINYKETIAYTISCETEVSVYGEGYSGNPFGMSIDGNNIALITENGKTVPDITYKLEGNISDVATINTRTGVITMKQPSSTKTAKVKISAKLKNGNTITSSDITVYFSWKAPELGNFVYADGSYSNAYMTSKTLMGIIFAISSSTTESGKKTGTAYVLGKEYLDEQYIGYSNDGSENAQDSRQDLYNVGVWLNEQVSGLSSTYGNVSGVTSSVDSDADQSITAINFKQKLPSNFTGKADTKAYVDYVNNTLLPLIKSKYPTLLTVQGNNYSISSMTNLNNLLNSIHTIRGNNDSNTLMECLFYPYFYETYLYEPEVTETEKATDAYQKYFSKGNWYVPSYQELATLIYYRGYSAKGSNFSTGDIPLKSSIVNDITKGSTDLTNPIFSTAFKNAGNYMPSAWNTLADSNNLCTNTGSTNGNYTYQQVENWEGSTTTYTYKWLQGAYTANNYGYGDAAAAMKGWRLYKHKPLPCVQFTYTEQ